MPRPCSLILNIVALVLTVNLSLLAKSVDAQPIKRIETDTSRYLAHIEANTFEELKHLLGRAAELFESGQFQVGKDNPIAFVLHGPEANSLLQKNYSKHKDIMDLAARLTAFGVVDIKVCRTWMGTQSLDETQLPPFVGTVPFGPAEHKRLKEEEKYVYF